MRLSTLSAVSAVALASNVFATVSSTLVADTYIVKDGVGASAKFYSVLDIYAKGTNLGDVMGGVSGLNGTSGISVVFATNKATGTGLTRDSNGKITAGTITSDIFKQAGNSSWNPSYSGAGSQWDSFIAGGNRAQGTGATVTSRPGGTINMGTGWLASTTFGGGQLNTANSNFIDNGGGSGWLNSAGSNPYSSAATAENPFARVSLYDAAWNAAYPSLDKSGDITKVKGKMQNGRTTAGGADSFGTAATGSTIDSTNNYFWMIGRFAIDVTQSDPNTPLTERITMNAQFNMVGKNGTGLESGTTFTGGSNASYKVSQFFTFEMPCPADMDRNRTVDTADVALLLLDFGSGLTCDSDLDGNGLTDTADLSLLLLDFGACRG